MMVVLKGLSLSFDRRKISVVTAWASLVIVPLAILWILYWPIASVDNEMLTRTGDPATILKHTCEAARNGIAGLLVAHGDHLIPTVYLFTGSLVILFGHAFEPFAASLLAWNALAITSVALLIHRISASLTIALCMACLLSVGWWLSRGAVSNYSEITSPMVIVFTNAALMLMKDLRRKRTMAEFVAISVLCLLALCTIAPGVLAFAIVGGSAGFAWIANLSRALAARPARAVAPDWRLVLGLFGALAVGLALYWYGQHALGNMSVGSQDFGRQAPTASQAERATTLLRAAISNVFTPNFVTDGSPDDNFYVGDEFRMGQHIGIPVAICVALVLGGLAAALHRAISRGDDDALDVAAIGLAAVAAALAAAVISILGRPQLALTFTRYLIFPLIFFATAVGLCAGYWLRQIGNHRFAWVGRAAAVGLVVLSAQTHLHVLSLEAPALQELRMSYAGGAKVSWWSDCPLYKP